jgi:hypothetical protein
MIRFVLRVWNEVSEDEVFGRAASLSYYFLFSLFPALLFLTALLGLLPWRLMDVLMDLLDRAAPTDIVHRTFAEIARGASGGLLSVGIAAALYSATSGMVAIIDSLNVAYDVVDYRSWWQRRLIALTLTVGVSLFTLTGLVLLTSRELSGRSRRPARRALRGVVGASGLGAGGSSSWSRCRPCTIAPARRPRWLDLPGSASQIAGSRCRWPARLRDARYLQRDLRPIAGDPAAAVALPVGRRLLAQRRPRSGAAVRRGARACRGESRGLSGRAATPRSPGPVRPAAGPERPRRRRAR